MEVVQFQKSHLHNIWRRSSESHSNSKDFSISLGITLCVCVRARAHARACMRACVCVCGCSSVGRASDWHAADTGLIPWCSKGFFFQSQLSVQTLLRACHTQPCAITCIDICVHIKDPVVHVRVQWIMETLKHQACTVGWVVWLHHSWLSPGESNLNYP